MPILLQRGLAGSNSQAATPPISMLRRARWRRPSAPQLLWPAGRWDWRLGGCRSVAAAAKRSPAAATAPSVEYTGTGAAAGEVEGPARGPDLQRYAPTGGLWASGAAAKLPRRWLAFSDLHVSHRTLGTCLQVLERVHEEARQRGAGILFLGDFWHTRGMLPVEPLNEVVLQLAEWRQPTLMLPGNHDQVSLGGEVHALTPLALSNPAIHAFDGPALFLDALWLPYRRRREELEAALAAASRLAPVAATAGGDGSSRLHAVFAHTDILGALMNEAYQAHDGLPPSLFPPDIPTYTGHYHNPHTVPGTRITYLGSPYQVTRAEAGQHKRLLLLDRGEGWEVAEELRLDLGPRYFAARATAAPSAPASPPEDATQRAAAKGVSAESSMQAGAAAPADAEAAPAAAAAAAQEGGYELVLPEGLRTGDRLLLTLPAAAVKQHQKRLRKLEKQGVEVEVFTPPGATAAPRISAAEGMGPLQLWERYCGWQRLSRAAAAAGSEVLRGLLGGATSDGAAAAERQHINLEFQAVEVEGYFSFREAVRYDLGSRGLVVVTGMVQDSGVESNGAGKTALTMAPLWALTGSTDARSEGGAGAGARPLLASIVNDEAKRARVRVEGRVNGAPFVVERTANKKSSSVTFQLDGEELTTQENRLTQERINRLLGAELLGRVVFHGQSDVGALLEASDRGFKEELSKLVDLEVWAQAKEASRGELSSRRGALQLAGARLDERKRQVAASRQQLAQLQEAAAEWGALASAAADGLRREADGLRGRLQGQQQALAAAVDRSQQQAAALAGELAEAERQLAELEAELKAAATRQGLQGSGEAELAAAEASLEAAQRAQQATQERQQLRQYELGAAHSAAADAGRQLREAQDAAAAAAAELSAFQQQNSAPPADTAWASGQDSLQRQQQERQQKAQLAEGRLAAARLQAATQQLQAATKSEAATRLQLEASVAQAAADRAQAALSATWLPGAAAAAAEGGSSDAAAALEAAKRGQLAAQRRLVAGERLVGAAQALVQEQRRQLDAYLSLRTMPNSLGGNSANGGSSRNGSGSGSATVQAAGQPVPTALAGSDAAAVHSHGGGGVCDRCQQPISQPVFEQGVARLQAAADSADQAADAAERKLAGLQQGLLEAEAAVRLAEQQSQAVAEAAAAEEAAQEAASAAVAAAAEAAEAVGALADLEDAAAAAETEVAMHHDVLHQLQEAATAAASAAALAEQLQRLQAAAQAAAAGAAEAEARQRGAEQHAAATADALRQAEAAAAGAAVAVDARQQQLQATQQGTEHVLRLEQRQQLLLARRRQAEQQRSLLWQQLEAASALLHGNGLPAAVSELAQLSGSANGSGSALEGDSPSEPDSEAAGLEAAVESALAGLAAAANLRQRWHWQDQQPNPHASGVAAAAAAVASAEDQVAEVQREQAALEAQLALWKQVDDAFRPGGVQNFVVEGVLGDLQAATARNLGALTSSMSLTLSPCKPAPPPRKRKAGGGEGEGEPAGTIEQIAKIVHVVQPGSLELRPRTIPQLSGGERKRLALALALGFSELAAQRGRLRSNLIVLDEVMQHLDGEGCLRVAQLLKQLPYSSVLVVAQAHSLLTRAFDSTDVVVKQGGRSAVQQGSAEAVS